MASSVASTSTARPAFIFSYNDQDADVAALVSTPSTSRQAYAGLGIASTYARSRQNYTRHGGEEGEDDWIPTYGPTTHRKGRMRFVAAKDPQFQVIPGYQDAPVVESATEQGENAVVEESAEPTPRRATVPGKAVRNLYASIVGLGKAAVPASSVTQSEPVSRRASPPPASSATPVATSSKKRPRTVSPPPRPVDTARWQVAAASNSQADIVLSSDSEDSEDDAVEAEEGGQLVGDGKRVEEEDDDDDLVVIDPLTGLPEVKGSTEDTAPRRLQPLLIHQLLPHATDDGNGDGNGAPLKPFVPPTQYAIKPDSPGWRLLARQGWREGLPLGPIVATPADGGEGGDAAGRLKVPLRAVEKRDRSGIGLSRPEDRIVVGALNSDYARRAREEKERERRRAEKEAKERRGKGERGMERQRKKEERERKAWIAYMNR
ncbi:hypothetical protein JCM10908_004925 [Rhodotorula pacifica]|uniref:uncharacterized protein n=1 Tax=Rhodotorula pacifica TaxID=1495444 RepID=UPI0031727E55